MKIYSAEERAVAVEILTIDLSETSIEAIADAVARRLSSSVVGNRVAEPHRTQSARPDSEEFDPWAETAGPTQARSQPSSGQPSTGYAPSTQTGSATGGGSTSGLEKTVETKHGTQYWRFAQPNAPLCDCNEPAGLLSALNKQGNRYKAWRCAKDAGENWRDKCEFSAAYRPRG